MLTFFTKNEVQDSIAKSGLSYFDETYSFFNFDLKGLGLSYQDDFDGIDPPFPYKIAGFSIFRNMNKTIYARSAYNFLTLVGDSGGFVDGLLLICGLVIAKWNRFRAMVFFMQEAFYTTSAQTFAKAKSSNVRYLFSTLRKR